jgi:hypothetical protein
MLNTIALPLSKQDIPSLTRRHKAKVFIYHSAEINGKIKTMATPIISVTFLSKSIDYSA